MTEENTAGMSTIKFLDGSSITVPFSSIKVRSCHVHIFIDGNNHSFNRKLLEQLPPELEACR